MTTANNRREYITVKQVGIRIPDHLKNRLEKIANRENNGVSAVIRRLLTQALDDIDKKATGK